MFTKTMCHCYFVALKPVRLVKGTRMRGYGYFQFPILQHTLFIDVLVVLLFTFMMVVRNIQYFISLKRFISMIINFVNFVQYKI